MRRKFTLILSVILFSIGPLKAQVVFDPATINPANLKENMAIVEIDGTKYLRVALDGGWPWFNLNGVVIADRHTRLKCIARYEEGTSGYTYDQVNTFLKFLTPSWGVLCEGGQASDTVFKEFYFDNLPPGETVGVFQIAGQETTGWSSVSGDTLWIKKVTVENPYAVIDPMTIDTAIIPDSWSVVDVDGTPYFKMIVDGWNGAAWWSIPEFKIPSKMNKLRFYSKYSVGGSHGYTVDQIQTWATWAGSGGNFNITSPCSSDFKMFAGDVTTTSIWSLQLVGQAMGDGWPALSGDSIWMSVVEPDWPYSIDVTSEGNATTIDTDLGQLQMYASALLPEGSDAKVVWSVIDPQLADIDESGLLSAFYDGTVTVVATGDNGYGAIDSMHVTLSNQVTGRLEVDTIYISVQEGTTLIDTKGGTLTLEGEVLPELAYIKDFTWSVADSANVSENEYAKINKYGLLTAKANGVITIYARADDVDTVRGSIDITITNQVEMDSIWITAEGDVTEINTKGGTVQLHVGYKPEDTDDTTFQWSMTPAGLATIDANNLLTAAGDGLLVIWATANDGGGAKSKIVLTLSNQIWVESITVHGEGSVTEIPVKGAQLQMVAILNPANASVKDVTWSVDHETIATISETGVLTAVTDGVVLVTATSDDPGGVSGSASITISNQSINVEDIAGKSLAMYPNPVSNELNIRNAGSIDRFEILSIDGRLILSVLNSKDLISIDVSGMEGGIYTLRAYRGSQVHVFKFVKE